MAGVADFNGDQKPDDYLFKPSTGAVVVWTLDGNAYTGMAILPTVPSGWQISAVADLNADGKPDLVLLNPTSRSLAVWFLNGTSLAGAAHFTDAGTNKTLPVGWKIAGVADVNRDGKPDLILYNPTTLQTTVWYLNGTLFTGQAAGPTIAAGWTLAGVADFTADGNPDFLIFNPSTRKAGIWMLIGTALVSTSYVVDAANMPAVEPAGYDIVAP